MLLALPVLVGGKALAEPVAPNERHTLPRLPLWLPSPSSARGFCRPRRPWRAPLATGGKPNHLKQVPPTKELRERIRAVAIAATARLDKSRPVVRHEIELHAGKLLGELELPESYAGWTMVACFPPFGTTR